MQDSLGGGWYPDTLPPRTLEMLAGDPILTGDPESDKTPTATVVRDGAKEGQGGGASRRRGSKERGPCPTCS